MGGRKKEKILGEMPLQLCLLSYKDSEFILTLTIEIEVSQLVPRVMAL